MINAIIIALFSFFCFSPHLTYGCMCFAARPPCRRTVSAVRVTPLRVMKSSPDLMPTGKSSICRIWGTNVMMNNIKCDPGP